MKLIDKAAVVAEIEKRVKEAEIVVRNIPSSAIFGLMQAYKNVLSFLDTLEVKEVDLEKDISYWLSEGLPNDEEEIDYIKETAKHFFELGLKAKGE